jgi:hypothetical protein
MKAFRYNRHGMLRSVWSTNFDGLTPKAAAGFELTAIEVGFECRERVVRQPARNELLCVSLHGDYRYDELKNTKRSTSKREDGVRRDTRKRALPRPWHRARATAAAPTDTQKLRGGLWHFLFQVHFGLLILSTASAACQRT